LRLSSAIVDANNNIKYQMFNQEQIREAARLDIASGTDNLVQQIMEHVV
jgi:hypothetical protein